MSDVESLSREDLIRLLNRANFVKDQQSNRLGQVLTENLELLSIVQEQQAEIERLRASSNGEVTTPDPVVDVTS